MTIIVTMTTHITNCTDTDVLLLNYISLDGIRKLMQLSKSINKTFMKNKIIKQLYEYLLGRNEIKMTIWAAKKGKLELYKWAEREYGYIDNNILIAAQYDQIKIVKYLVELHMIDLHKNDDYVLKLSITKGNLLIVKYLIEHGADIDIALIWSIFHNQFQIMKYLVESGADIHVQSERALLDSVGQGHLRIVKYLIEKGANIHANNEKELTSAIANGDFDMVKCLVENGANICKDDVDNALFRCCGLFSTLDDKSKAIVEYLLLREINYYAKHKYKDALNACDTYRLGDIKKRLIKINKGSTCKELIIEEDDYKNTGRDDNCYWGADSNDFTD